MSLQVRQTLDVSHLPSTAMDHRSPVWWGNTLLLLIESTMFAILIAGYFYLRQNFAEWPPVQPSSHPPLHHHVPVLGPSLLNLLVIFTSVGSMLWADRAALQRNQRAMQWGLIGTITLGLIAIVVRWFEFHALLFRWDDNAYGSITWTILGMHVMHLIVGVCELSLMLVWVLRKGLDDKHARDVHITAIYWYWIAVMWLLLWSIVFVGPRVL